MSNQKLNIFKDVLRNSDIEMIEENYLLSDEEFNRLQEYIQVLNRDDFQTTKEKGDYFEEFINYILNCTNIFRCMNNIRTHTNEIDIRAEFTLPAQEVAKYYQFDENLTLFFECKNYLRKKVGVEHIGKFFSLLVTSKKDIGILVSPNGITGQSWRDGSGLCKKIALIHGTKILSLTFDDLLKLKNKSLFTILKEKVIEIEEDFNIEKYITHHDLEGKL
ncbi:restriction endonuclease [Staphylococcus cornubiensis]|uniref:restriction endonuclease n=1 Tax=Staphylococcus cornubiensis TaxID=1986155 RepID=UPI000A3726EB|nr:restriction endonuclease [Staphylococcus cornubiensis]